METTTETAPVLLEQHTVEVTSLTEPTYRKAYSLFGWELVPEAGTKGTLHFVRDRRIPDRAELTALQRSFDDGLSRVRRLERSAARFALTAGLTVGLLGVAALAIAVFSFLGDLLPVFFLAAGLGPALCTAAPFIAANIRKVRSAATAPRIDREYGRALEACDAARALRGAAEESREPHS